MRISDWSSDVCSSDLLTSLRPISQGVPAYLMEVKGDAPVPPTWPATRMTSACALATPAATVPMPAWLTSFTQTRALGLIRSEERRVGKECVSTCRSRGSPSHEQKKNKQTKQTHQI